MAEPMKTALVQAEGDPYLEGFATAFGRVWVNLIVLENELRYALYGKHNEGTDGAFPMVRFVDLAPGTSVPINWITCSASLSELISEFNKVHPSAQIGDAVVHFRNALAHGRILGQTPDPVLHLLRFPRQLKGDTATVMEQNIPLTIVQLHGWSSTVANIVKAVRDATT